MSSRRKIKWPKVIGTKVPIYGGTVVLTHSRKDFAQCVNFCIRDSAAALVKEDEIAAGGAATSLRNGDGNRMYVVGVFDGSRRTLVHELAHASFHILGDVGVDTPAGEKNEAYCYLLDYLYSEFEPELKKKKPK